MRSFKCHCDNANFKYWRHTNNSIDINKSKMINSTTTTTAWYLDDESQKHLSPEVLKELGYELWMVNEENKDSCLDQFCKQRNLEKRTPLEISSRVCSKEHLDRLSVEHLHENDEVRFVTNGSGYLDLRDKQDRWIRFKMEKNYLSIVPTGAYHRVCD
jgi:mannose-6-phosphate isomerase-like protein (cupin superfamily)